MQCSLHCIINYFRYSHVHLIQVELRLVFKPWTSWCNLSWCDGWLSKTCLSWICQHTVAYQLSGSSIMCLSPVMCHSPVMCDAIVTSLVWLISLAWLAMYFHHMWIKSHVWLTIHVWFNSHVWETAQTCLAWQSSVTYQSYVNHQSCESSDMSVMYSSPAMSDLVITWVISHMMLTSRLWLRNHAAHQSCVT